MRTWLLHQILHLLEPIGFLWFCLLLLTAALWWRKQRGFACATGFLALFMTVIGSTPLPGLLLVPLERPYAGIQLDALPNADAIVLLGGGANPSRFEVEMTHLTPAGDRLVMAHAVYKKGKAPVVVLGGNVIGLDNVTRFECDVVRDLFVTWGIPKDAMIPLGANGDTHDEAVKVGALAREHGWKRVLLVTSANHQRRASATFRAQGLEVVPVACNFLSRVGNAPGLWTLEVPRAGGFGTVATWLHEQVGWIMYRKRGWITE